MFFFNNKILFIKNKINLYIIYLLYYNKLNEWREITYITTFASKIVDETSIKLTWSGSYNTVSIYKTTNKRPNKTTIG
jgi:hypothetical protein